MNDLSLSETIDLAKNAASQDLSSKLRDVHSFSRVKALRTSYVHSKAAVETQLMHLMQRQVQ